MPADRTNALTGGNPSAVDAFLREVAAAPVPHAGGRLLFALDATASRQPTWDLACHLQAEMFSAAAAQGRLAIQLAYFRGFGEFHASAWVTDAPALVRCMTGVTCLAGRTQMARVLGHAIRESEASRLSALVYVGDSMEEPAPAIVERAGQLALRGVPAFLFHEGDDALARTVFRQVAQVTGGAYARFDAASAGTLRDLLRAVAVYAACGRKALADYASRAGGEVLRLTQQLR